MNAVKSVIVLIQSIFHANSVPDVRTNKFWNDIWDFFDFPVHLFLVWYRNIQVDYAIDWCSILVRLRAQYQTIL